MLPHTVYVLDTMIVEDPANVFVQCFRRFCIWIDISFSGKLDEFKRHAAGLASVAREDLRCLFYDWMVSGTTIACRQGYLDPEALLARLKNEDQGPLLLRSVMTSLNFHGPEDSLNLLRSSLGTSFLSCVPEFFETLQ